MAKPAHLHPADLRGLARLAADGTRAVTDIVEAMHEAVVWPPFLPSFRPSGRTGGLPGLVYSAVRGTAGLVGDGIDLLLAPLVPLFGERLSTPERDTLVSILNGVLGDHLSETANPLALGMELRRSGRRLVLERSALAAALPRRSSRVAVLVHGLCGTDSQWKRAAFDYGTALERDFGYTPVYLRYNSGLHISTNGRAAAAVLEALVREWPGGVEEMLLLGHSMGGLVARSAFQHGATWTASVRRMAFLGSPHHGAPLERGGAWFQQELLGVTRYAAPFARLGRLRSAGITDLRHGSILDEDWRDADRFERSGRLPAVVPLPGGVDCLAVAATTGEQPGDVRDILLVGDGLVPVESALGRHPDPRRDLGLPSSRAVVLQRTHHMALLGDLGAYEAIASWLGGAMEPVA